MSMSLAHRRLSNSTASLPRMSSFANEDWSNSPADSFVAAHSAAIAGDQCRPAQPSGRAASAWRGALAPNQLTRSQPAFSPSAASRSASLGQIAERRSGRAAVHSWYG